MISLRMQVWGWMVSPRQPEELRRRAASVGNKYTCLPLMHRPGTHRNANQPHASASGITGPHVPTRIPPRQPHTQVKLRSSSRRTRLAPAEVPASVDGETFGCFGAPRVCVPSDSEVGDPT